MSEMTYITEQRSPILGTLEFEGMIVRYRIIGTRHEVYELWEPIVTREDRQRFSSQRTIDGEWYGQVGVGLDHDRRSFSEEILIPLVEKNLNEEHGGRWRRDCGRISVVVNDPED